MNSILLMAAPLHLPPPTFPENRYRGFRRHDFQFGNQAVVIVEPECPAPGRRWVWRAEFFDAFPEFDLEMLRRGWWLVYLNVGNTFGAPSAMTRFDLFYRELVDQFHFHPKPVLEGLSRGGLYIYRWAAENPSCVGLLYGDNPVCDFKSWPGGKGRGPGSAADWAALLKCYQFENEEEALAWPFNPVDWLEAIPKPLDR